MANGGDLTPEQYEVLFGEPPPAPSSHTTSPIVIPPPVPAAAATAPLVPPPIPADAVRPSDPVVDLTYADSPQEPRSRWGWQRASRTLQFCLLLVALAGGVLLLGITTNSIMDAPTPVLVVAVPNEIPVMVVEPSENGVVAPSVSVDGLVEVASPTPTTPATNGAPQTPAAVAESKPGADAPQTPAAVAEANPAAIAEAQPAIDCQGYDPCIAPGADADCVGTGDGPRFSGRVRVTGLDPYDLDADGDGWGCENS